MNTAAERFANTLSKKRIKPGLITGTVLEYLSGKGLSKSFQMKREGDIRYHIYVFYDDSKLVLKSKPREKDQGLELISIEIEKPAAIPAGVH